MDPVLIRDVPEQAEHEEDLAAWVTPELREDKYPILPVLPSDATLAQKKQLLRRYVGMVRGMSWVPT